MINTIFNLILLAAWIILASFVFVIHQEDISRTEHNKQFVEECEGDVIRTYQRLYCIQKGVIIKTNN